MAWPYRDGIRCGSRLAGPDRQGVVIVCCARPGSLSCRGGGSGDCLVCLNWYQVDIPQRVDPDVEVACKGSSICLKLGFAPDRSNQQGRERGRIIQRFCPRANKSSQAISRLFGLSQCTHRLLPIGAVTRTLANAGASRSVAEFDQYILISHPRSADAYAVQSL